MLEKIKNIVDPKNAVLLLFLVVAVSLMYNTLTVIQKNYELQQQISTLEQEVALVELQNQNLQFNIEYYNTDAFLEVEAKRRFNVAEAGEKVLLLPKNGDKPVVREQAADQVEAVQIKPRYQQNFDSWMQFIFGSTQ